ncbi:OmpH family outer membrane protein [Halocynthiibacter sp.]|uniref:OmpH family outer membrane protein n=1 Tax=Halocynthiibacter sp. TaxID=1979210 RepID=UPI003C3E24D9
MGFAKNTPGGGQWFLPGVIAFSLLLGCATATTVFAQDTEAVEQTGDVVVETDLISPLLTIEQELLYARSALGRTLEAMLNDERGVLQSENQVIFDALSAEEGKLVILRSTTDPEAFSILAREFDDRVQAIRAEQDQKLRALVQRREEVLSSFMNLVVPLVAQSVRARGGLAVVERSSIFLSVRNIDITADAIERIDAVYPEGVIPGLFFPQTGSEAPDAGGEE